MKTIVIGVGNPIRRDDGIGVKVARMVREKISGDMDVSRPRPRTAGMPFTQVGGGGDVSVAEVCAGGMRLMDELVGYDRAIIVDAIQTSGGVPGTVYRFSPENIKPTRNTDCMHDTTLTDALNAGRELGMRLPADITIFAVEAVNVDNFGETMTAEVEAAAAGVADRVLALCGGREVAVPGVGNCMAHGCGMPAVGYGGRL